MKNFITYFYGVNPKTIRYGKTGYFFSDEKNEYVLKENIRKKEELYELLDLTDYLRQFGIYFHEIILNNFNDVESYINGKNYVLLKVSSKGNRNISFNDILKLTGIEVKKEYKYIVRSNWNALWREYMDYIESVLPSYQKNNDEVTAYVDYNIGLVENAIQLLSDMKGKGNNICHIRLNPKMTLIEFYNPCNVVLDSKSRDFCEYYRSSLDDNIIPLEQVQLSHLNVFEQQLFFIRFLYNITFFDALINHDESNGRDNDLKYEELFNNVSSHEKAIKSIYKYYFKSVLPEIEWIKKAS